MTAVKVSNRFVGPALRMQRAMNEVAEGRPTERLLFRNGDFWRGMADDFNSLIDRGYFSNHVASTVSEGEVQRAR